MTIHFTLPHMHMSSTIFTPSQMHRHSCAYTSHTQTYSYISHTPSDKQELTHSYLFTQRHILLPIQSPTHPAQLGHAGHIERSLGILVRVVLPEEVVDFVIIGLVLVHDGSLNELWIYQ